MSFFVISNAKGVENTQPIGDKQKAIEFAKTRYMATKQDMYIYVQPPRGPMKYVGEVTEVEE